MWKVWVDRDDRVTHVTYSIGQIIAMYQIVKDKYDDKKQTAQGRGPRMKEIAKEKKHSRRLGSQQIPRLGSPRIRSSVPCDE